MTYNDPGVVKHRVSAAAIRHLIQGVGFSNQAIAFGNYTVNAAGNDDNLFIYGDTGVQAYVATPTQARMPVGSQVLLGNNFKRVYAYGMGGNDTATYSGLGTRRDDDGARLLHVRHTISTVQYFDSFKKLTVAGKGGLDIAVMYDTSGVDSFTASDTSFRYTRSGVFNNIANGYDRVYAFNYFGGFDTATLNGSSGNDRLTSIANYSVLVTPTTLQQAIGFRTVIVNAGTGTDTATLQDSTGSDTLNAFAGTAELVYSNGRTARAIGFDTVNANGTLGGTNRRNLNSPTYQLKFKGRGCRFGSDQFAFDALARPDRCWMWSRSHSGAPTRPKSRLSSRWTLVPQAPYTLRSPQPTQRAVGGFHDDRRDCQFCLCIEQQSRPKTNPSLATARCDAVGTAAAAQRGAARPIDRQRLTLGHHEQTETTPTNRAHDSLAPSWSVLDVLATVRHRISLEKVFERWEPRKIACLRERRG